MSVVDFAGKALTQNEINDRVQELRLLVLGDNVLRDFRTYDEYLLRFLYFKDFNVNTAFKVMQDYTKLMIKYPKWYPSVTCIDKMCNQKEKAKGFIHGRDRCGRPIYVVEVGRTDPSKSSPTEEACSDEVWFESVMDNPEAQAKGLSVIIDLTDISWKMIQWFTPSAVKTSAAKADLYPCKVLIYHIVNNSTLVSTAVKLIWPFVSEKTKKNVIFHFDNWSSLHEHISPEVLPAKYGGTGPDIDFEQLHAKLFENRRVITEKIAVDQKNLQKLVKKFD